MQARLNALKTRHEILEAKIHGERSRPKPDDLRLTILKRMKLRIRDDIARIEHALLAETELFGSRWNRRSGAKPTTA